MKLGYIADLAVIAFFLVNVILAVRRGFVRSLLRYTSTFLAVIIAITAAAPLANFLNGCFGLVTAIEGWHIPFIKASTLFTVLIGIAIFVIMRLLFIFLDKFLNYIRERVAAVNVLDRILGLVFGVAIGILELAGIFMLINMLSLQTFLQLTPESGGLIAPYIFSFFKAYLFPIVGGAVGAVNDTLPKF